MAKKLKSTRRGQSRTGKPAGKGGGASAASSATRTAPKPSAPTGRDLFIEADRRQKAKISSIRQEQVRRGEVAEITAEYEQTVLEKMAKDVEAEYLAVHTDMAPVNQMNAMVGQVRAAMRLEAASPTGRTFNFKVGAKKLDEKAIAAMVESLKDKPIKEMIDAINALEKSHSPEFASAVSAGLLPHLTRRGIKAGDEKIQEWARAGEKFVTDTAHSIAEQVGPQLRRAGLGAGKFFRSLGDAIVEQASKGDKKE